ncbi:MULTISPECIES: methyl-accepting chemotaxis protein [Paenibacillus]|uniref:methyl-accepting chemotaxis protein n=1 Tax=Paenibacillus TaxID=44249 RepID=UPI00201E0366|nr:MULTISPECIES: methyl-accepting chemotaxis protein [Paenibacillus]MCL6662611.1 methyl-accepting chemotaxis protein [Paenibacillus amylolyticus]WJM07281.1 methyl-accepting chemotaxis protein [Paenibacillus sp. PK1-4R]
MKRVSISRKLLLGFGSVLLLLVAVVIISYTQFVSVEKTFTDLIRERTAKLLIIKNMIIDVKSQQVALRNFVTEENDQSEQQFKSFYEDYRKTSEELRSGIQTPTMIDYLDRSDRSAEEYYAFGQNVIELKRQGETGEITRMLLETGPTIISGFEETVTAMEQHQQNSLDTGIVNANQLIQTVLRLIIIIGIVSIVLGVVIALIMGRIISKPVAHVARAASRIADGDLTGEAIVVRNRDEIGELAESFNKMMDNLRHLIHQVGHNADRVAASSEELTASTEQTATATEQVATTMEEIATGMDTQVSMVGDGFHTISELSTGFQQMTENTQNMSDEATNASAKTITGNDAVQSAVEQMNSIHQTVRVLATVIEELGNHSDEIGSMVESISEISAQTNLLSLNAAIEAARAGEHGRGFEVVATEVRKLSDQSAKSAEQISVLVAAIRKGMNNASQSMGEVNAEVQEGIELVRKAGGIFEEIREAVSNVAGQTQEVSASIEQMAAGVEQINVSMKTIMEVTENAAAGTEEVSATSEEQLSAMQEIASAANDLSSMAEELQESVSRFKV